MTPSVSSVKIKKVTTADVADVTDLLVAEEPLEIKINYGSGTSRTQKSIAVTMRTPGNDLELAAGFLITEGILKSYSDILYIRTCEESENVVKADIREDAVVDLRSSDRNFYTTSSCGICGKTSIDAVKVFVKGNSIEDSSVVESNVLMQLPAILRSHQDVFEHTGGLHAAALFNVKGNLVLLREDVGRHNAVDKVIGASAALKLVMDQYILLLSGRAGFELIQKAAVAGIGIVAAVGAPSGLAVSLAEEAGMTLIGFLRDQRFNIYTGEKRIVIQQSVASK
jgi:FdhD protein